MSIASVAPEAPSTGAQTAPPPPTPPVSVPSRAHALMDAMARLSETLRQETAMIRERRTAGLDRLVDGKLLLVRAFDEAGRALRVDRDALAALGEADRQRLRALADEFRAAAEANAASLRAAAQASQSVVDTLVTTLNREQAADQGYTLRGGMALPAGFGHKGGRPATLDQQL